MSRDDWTAIAVSLSTNAVKLYSPQTGQYLGEFKGHSSVINEISFTGPSTSHILYSSSSDGTIRAWDTRSFQQVCTRLQEYIYGYFYNCTFISCIRGVNYSCTAGFVYKRWSFTRGVQLFIRRG